MSDNEPSVSELLDLRGKVAVVTGAAGWLGAAMSRALAEAGAAMAVTSREGSRARDLAEALPGGGHHGFQFDQGDADAIPEFLNEVNNKLGQVDILVNNAYGGTNHDIETVSTADFDDAYHLGVTAPFVLAREVANHLRTRGASGSIINIASMYGVVGSYPEAYSGHPVNSPASYHAMKGGLVHLTRHLAVYWAKDGIRVNAISPGPFPGAETQRAMPEFIDRLNEKVPMGRMGRPEELKGIVVLLASDAGSYITGQNILVDGGWTAW